MLAVATLAQDVESLFEQGAACLEAGDGQGALKYFQQAAELEPNEPGIVYNTGIAASMTGDYTLSIASFSRYRQLVPDDALGLTKLIQAYQGAGQDSEAEQQIAELRRWWKAGKLRDTYIAKERSFFGTALGWESMKSWRLSLSSPTTRSGNIRGTSASWRGPSRWV